MRKLTAIGELFILLLTLAVTAEAQLPDFHVQVINKRNGVNLAGAFEVIQDAKGFLWILSDDHIQRYDGKTVKVFQPAAALKNIYCDADGRIWCVSQQSVMRYVNDHIGFVPIPVDTTAEYLYSLHQLQDGSIWCSHTQGLLKYSEAENRFVAHSLPFLQHNSKPSYGMIVKAVHHGHSFCIVKRDSVFVWNASGGKYTGIRFAKPNLAVFIKEDRLLLTSYDAITKEWDLTTGELNSVVYPKYKPEPGSFFYARRSLPLGADDCYLLSNKGLLHVTGPTGQAKKLRLFLDGIPLPGEENIRYISKGRDGKIFLMHESGILYFDRLRHGIETIRNLSSDLNRHFGNRPTECLLDEKQNLWIGSHEGFTRWNLLTNEHKHYKATLNAQNALQHPIVWHLAQDGKNILVAPDQQGLLIFDPLRETFRRPVFPGDSSGKKMEEHLNQATIYFIYKLRNGNFLMANKHGVFVMARQTYQVSRLSLPRNVMYYLCAVEMKDGSVWFGTMRGLIGTDSQFVFQKQIAMPGEDKEVTALCETGSGALIAGCKQLYEIANPFNDSPVVKPFLPQISGKVISTLYKDPLGFIWAGTPDGMYRCHPDSSRVHRITSPDHVAGRHQLQNFFEAPDGTVFFSSQNGINYFRPKDIDPEDDPPEVFITNVTVNNDDSSYLLHGAIGPRLPSSQNSLVFDFVTPHLQPATVQYRYRMRGFDRNWVGAGANTQVRYAALSPGEYSFEVAATTDGIHWYTASQRVSFSIAPPFWRTSWFTGLCLTALAAIAWAVYRYRRNRRQEKDVQQLIDYFASSGYEHSSVEDILWDIARNCISRLNFEDCVIYLLDEQSGKLHQKAAYGPKSPNAFTIMNPIEIAVGQGIVGTVAQTGKAEIVTDTRVDKRYIVDDQPRLSEITVPIIHEGKVIGIIDSENSRRNFFREKHIQVLQTIANLCSAKISRAMALDAIRKSKLQLMELNMKMAESKFLNLRLQMNPHFLFNSLSSIQHLVVSEQTSRAYKYLTVFSNLLRSLLQYAESNFISLDNELAMLRMYLDLETLRFDGSFRYSITVDESLEQEEVLIPSLMVQPFAENAIWHGLLHKEGEKKLCIEFSNHHDDYLTCIIEDNGIGREQAAAIQQKKISSMVHESKGIRIIRERLSLLQQKTGKPARVEILDKKNDHLQPAGTRVIIIIPFYNKEEA